MRKRFYTMTGKVEAVSEAYAYECTRRNLVVDGRYIHMTDAAMMVRPEPQVGDTVTLECFDREYDGEVFTCGASVKVLKADDTCVLHACRDGDVPDTAQLAELLGRSECDDPGGCPFLLASRRGTGVGPHPIWRKGECPARRMAELMKEERTS